MKSPEALIRSRPPTQTIYAGFSGGLDSTVLLHALLQQLDPASHRLNAIHVHHGLHPRADAWSEHCRAQCARWGIALNVVPIAIADSGRNLEQQARDARYRAFDGIVPAGACLALAHHQNDVAETLLLRLMRGSGTEALGNMRDIRPHGHYSIWRPLLHCSRSELEQYAAAHQLTWIDDSSNADERFDRNFIRHRILPALAERFPEAAQRLAHSASLMSADAELLQPLIVAQTQHCADGMQLSVARLLARDPALQAHVIRFWLQQHGKSMPSSAGLAEFLRQLSKAADDDATQLAYGDTAVRVWDEKLFVLDASSAEPPEGFDRTWDGLHVLALPRGGTLHWQGSPPGITRVTYRTGGERIVLAGRSQSQSVKKLLSTRLPPWQRDRLPFVYNEQDELLAVGDVLVAHSLQQHSGTLIWHHEP